jgi:signal transduction histidine kinase
MATILVIDDEAVNRDLARTLLSRKGYTILEASGGAEGLRTAIRARPDVVVTDVLMPDMDGYQLVGELRARPELAHTPVVFYTSNYLESQARPLAEACGVSQIVVRSEDPARLIEAVGAALEGGPPVGIPPLPADFDRHHAQVINSALLAKIRELQVSEKRIRSLNASLVQEVQEVQEHSIRLERANKDLEAFAYSVAHDLRTPLRGISGFAGALAEDYGDRLGETGREYAGRIEAGCTRMATLLDALLHLTHVSRAEMNLQDVDLSAEVTAICDQLRTRDPGRQVQVTVQEGVRVTADRALIRSALDNLLDNAWKFTARRDDAAIEFATVPVGDARICCYVRDNGAGFDSAYVSKLFQPFQRLHDAEDFPGTGVGLATVRRIIDRHGGRTWAEGIVGGGATIYFTLNAEGLMNDKRIILVEENPDDHDLTIQR